jgi:hypothetical protein
MKKILAVFLVLGVVLGGVAFALMRRTPEQSACMRVADLCGVKDGTKEDLDKCVADVGDWRRMAGDEAVDKGMKCVAEAKTCGEAMGCTTGAGIKGVQGIVNDFMKGLGKGLQ